MKTKPSKLAPKIKIIIAFGVICAFLVFIAIESSQRRTWNELFTFEAEEIIHIMKGKMEINNQILLGIRSLFYASKNVTPEEFEIYVKPLIQENDFIQALEWIPRVPESERKMFEKDFRYRGLPQFQIWERSKQGEIVRASSRSEYFPVFYLHPLKGNEAAWGFDLASNPIRLAALNISRDGGKFVATDKIRLVQETGYQNGILVFLPVFDGNVTPETVTERRSKLAGFILGVYRMEDMFKNIIPDLYENIEFSVYEGDTIDETEKLAGEMISNAPLQFERIIDFHKKKWLVVIQGNEDFLAGYHTYYAYGGAAAVAFVFISIGAIFQAAHTQSIFEKNTAVELTQLFDKANAPIFGVDTHGNISEWNQKMEEITEFTKAEVLGQTLDKTNLIKGKHINSITKVLNGALQGQETSNYELPLFSKSGERVIILLNATTRRNINGDIVGVVGIGQDITKLHDFRKNLQEKVWKQTQEIHKTLEKSEETNRKLQKANRAKSQFLSSMSHELRTPLNAIMGFGDLLHGQHFGKLNDKQFDYVNQIGDSGKHLLELINDLLDVAKIDAGEMKLIIAECLPEECFPAVISMVQPQLDKKNIKIESCIDPSVKVIFCDIRKVKQIMINLLSNAIKYTPAGGVIKVDVMAEDNHTKIFVTDKGIGISEANQKLIFDEFLQVDRARDEALGGIGIGLALTRRLVELHGGDIGVQSKLGEGSAFWFTLPMRQADSLETPFGENPVQKINVMPTGKRILVVEDNEVNLSMVLDMLSIQDHEVFVARNGKEAIDLAQSSNPELILMDVRMPVMDGLEATKILKANSDTSHIPIIALTASVGGKSKEACLAAGCQDHLPKPITSKNLFDMLQKYLNPNT